MSHGFDPACADLARHFLENGADQEKVAALAQHIQDAVEDFLHEPEECEMLRRFGAIKVVEGWIEDW
jgi:hypothetical protein